MWVLILVVLEVEIFACGGELIWLWEKEEEEEEEKEEEEDACGGEVIWPWLLKEEEVVTVKGRRRRGRTIDWAEIDKDKDKVKEIDTNKR